MRFRTPRFVILVIAAVGALAMCGTRVSAKVPWVFKNLNNALGVADRQGYCSVWCYFDETVDAGGGIELPIRFQFNSYQRSMADSCLGAGWWFPLLESTVTRDSEKNIRVNLPGGDVVRLYPSKTEQGKFHTLDNTRTGAVLEGVLTMEGKDGWRFTYEAGRLKEAGTPGGDVLRWEYDGNRATRITSRTSGALLEATHDPATGLIEGITFNEGKENMRLGYADAPLTTTSKNGGSANRLVKSLGSVRSRDFAATISFRSVDEARSVEMVVDYANEGGEKGVDKYRWSAETGLIQRDNFGPYVVRGGGVNPGDAVFYVENVTREGKKKSYQYDRKKNEEVYGAEDGRKFIYQYVETPGPDYNKLRRVTDIMPDGKEIISFIGFFDQSGILRRKLEASGRYTEILYIKSWDPAEAIPLMCKFTLGEKEELEVVGPQGRLIGAVITGEPYVYIHAADGKLLDRPSMMNYLRSHPEISVPKDLPPWLEAAFDHEGRRQSGQ